MQYHKMYHLIETALTEALHRYGLQEQQSALHAANRLTNSAVYSGSSSANYLTNFFLTLLDPNRVGPKLLPTSGPMPIPAAGHSVLFPVDYRPDLFEVLRAYMHVSGFTALHNRVFDCCCKPDLVCSFPDCFSACCKCCKAPYPTSAKFINHDEPQEA